MIAHGARAATMMSSLVLENDRDPPLRERVLAKIRAVRPRWSAARTAWASTISPTASGAADSRRASHRRGGNVAYISHSGSGMCGIVDSEERIDFNLVVSTGQELAVSMDEYLDFALEHAGDARGRALHGDRAQPGRDWCARSSKARASADIPIVALKVGRTELSAKLTVSHSGAIAGRGCRLSTRSSIATACTAPATWTSSRRR